MWFVRDLLEKCVLVKNKPEEMLKRVRFSCENRTLLELLPGFGPGTSSLPIDPAAFLAVPIHTPGYRPEPCTARVWTVFAFRSVSLRVAIFQAVLPGLLENLLETPAPPEFNQKRRPIRVCLGEVCEIRIPSPEGSSSNCK